MGFDKSLENYVRVWRICKVQEPESYGKCCVMKIYRNKDCGINLTQFGVVVSEIQPNKVEVAKKVERWVTFLEAFEATKVLACFEKILNSRFTVVGNLQLYISFVSEEKNIF